MKTRRIGHLALMAALALLLIANVSEAQTNTSWADSLSATKGVLGKSEHSLQYYLDSLGYDIDVEEDELGIETFCGMPGLNTATMIIEVAGSAVYSTSGYYKAGSSWPRYQLFGPSDGPGDSVQFNISVGDSIGFYMKPNLPGENRTWFSEVNLNSDHYDHALVFPTGIAHEYLIAWEDMSGGGDADYQDLVIRVTFANHAPELAFSTGDSAIVACDLDSVCFDIQATDANCQGDSIWLEMVSGEGDFNPVAGVASIDATHCFVPTGTGIYQFIFRVEDELGAFDQDTLEFDIRLGTAPTVTIDDSSVFLCSSDKICLPVEIVDNDCDVVSVNTNAGAYSGTLSDFDQVARINELGGTVTQIGGGAPGNVLSSASDFVPPVNSQSGVNVTLPNFLFADLVVDYGSFPSGIGPSNSADHLLGAPTDMTFTLPGAGGPDGGDGDGSIAIQEGQYCVIGFSQDITTCHGANVDFCVFTNTNGDGAARLEFRYNGTTVHVVTQTLPGGSASSGMGGATLDLPDGLTFNEVRVSCQPNAKCVKIEVDAFAARTAPSPTTEDICFTADTTGVYDIIVTATDACGFVGADTAHVTVTLNSPPVANAGNDQTMFVCELEEICLPVSFFDPDNNLAITEKTEGLGTLEGGQICFTPTLAGAYTFVIHAVDECGLEDYDTVMVNILDNDPPVADHPSPVTMFQCEVEEICHTFTATDPNGGTLTWTHLAGAGAITTNGEFCFTPTISGTYPVSVIVTDSCGAADTTSIIYNVTINTAPVAVDPTSPVQLTQCTAEEICYQFQANDTQGGPLTWSPLSGVGILGTNGYWCFTPGATGTYSIEAVVTDSCGLADTTTLTYEVIVNEPPTVAFGEDLDLTMCEPEEVCVSYTVNDPNGSAGLIEEMISGFGTIDTAANEICFTPTTDGSYELIVRVKDSCNASDRDTIVVDVTFGDYAEITCPSEDINVSLCSTDTVCQMIDINPAGASISVSHGVYANGELCFFADTSGTYVVTIIAEALCGADTCEVTFNVDIGEAAEIDCPEPQSVFICEADTICTPVGVMGTGAVVTVSPIGNYASGSLCFFADTAGHYEIQMIAGTECGTDTCIVVTDVTINSAPVATDPVTPVDTFLCTADQICYQFAATDIDGGPLTWSRLSGQGTVSASGQWCFNANSSDTYSVVAMVKDSCLAADTVTLTYNVAVNTAPQFAFGHDTTIFMCSSAQLCLPVIFDDVDGNIAEVTLLEGPGTIFTNSSLLCFWGVEDGTLRFVGQITDSCGASDVDTLLVTIEMNTPPTVNAGSDQTIFQCTAAEICWPAGASDPDGNIQTVELIGEVGSYDGTNICFTPTGTLDYEFVLKATDECGEEAFDTVVVYYTLNSPPVADAGNDSTLFLCAPEPVCWPVSCSDIDDNLSGCALISGPGVFDGSEICFTPGASGLYTFIVQASDACGELDEDTVAIDVTINSTPICHVPDNTVIFQCTPAEVCLPVWAEDADDNLDYCQIVSGQGTLTGGNWCYTPTASQTTVITIRCVDECGAECVSHFTVEFEINEAPSIAFGADIDTFLCAGTEICLPYAVDDENDPRERTTTLISGPGTLDEVNSRVCFNASATGLYTFIIGVEDECGEIDRDTINVDVTINTPPTADAGTDLVLFLCDVDTTICWPAGCSDPDDNLDECLFNGPGTYDGSNICFVPAISGDYVFTLQAIDECGEEALDSVVINITVNSTPTLTLDDDFAVELCDPEEICVNYTVDDPDGLSGVVEDMISGYGSINTADNKVCFTPTVDGNYEIVVRATDPCGAFAEDTIVVAVTFGDVAAIDCPTGPIDVSLCDVETICQGLNITPGDAVVSTSFGSYSGGELCFLADTSGIYVIEVIAEADCGADTCEIVFNVDIGSAAEIDCPDPMAYFLCEPEDICFPIGIMGTEISVTVSPVGNYNRGNVCFEADTAGHYELTIIASTPCGSDTCVATIDVTLNSAPVAVDPAVVDTFLCDPAQICLQFEAADVDGDPLTWNRLSGNGTVTDGGLWCFNASATGTYTVNAQVTDTCGAFDQITASCNVTLNGPPIVTLGNDTLTFLCTTGEVCFAYGVTDPNDNVESEEIISNDVTPVADTAANEVCFTAPSSGPYEFIVRATDACGAIDEDTIVVAVMYNSPPVANAGEDFSLFLCTAEPICSPAGGTDVDSNLDSCYETTGTGTYNGSNICFTPDTSGVYTLILRAVDLCGAADEDTLLVTVTINSPPVCQLPDNSSFFQCTPEQVSLPVSAVDTDDNFDHCELVAGPGSIIGGNWVYTPSTDEQFTVAVMCLDECGASCTDSFAVTFDINAPPTANAGNDTTFFLCHGGQLCWAATCTDEDDNLSDCEVLAPAGATLVDDMICMTVAEGDKTNQIYTVVIQATDACGETDLDSAVITVDFNSPPVVNAPPDFVAYLEAVGELCFSVPITDDEGIEHVYVSQGAYNEATGQVCFTADTTGLYCFEIRAVDECGDETIDSVCIDVQIDECIHVQIEKTHDVIQGQHNDVNIFLNGSGHELGGFDLLIHYDQTALLPNTVLEGDLFTLCGWEYFTYRFGPDGNCDGCPSGLIRIVAMAETNNGAYHPGCFLDGMTGTLATIDFLVSNDRTLECQYIPVEFFWYDCGDNAFSSKGGDTLWVSRSVFDFEYNNITNTTYGFPGYYGVPDECLTGDFEGKPVPIRCVDFTNGGVDIICADSIDARGDLNLNGIPYEIADAVMYTNYFIQGLSAFPIGSPQYPHEASIAASDANADGLPLTVADLVYLIRIVIGDAPAMPKIAPGEVIEAAFSITDNVLCIDQSNTAIGAIYVLLEGRAAPTLASAAEGMEMQYRYDGENTRVLIYNMQAKQSLNKGEVLNINGPNTIKTIEVGGIDGQIVTANYRNLPDHFSLSQNYPNPFNPLTTIEFALPVAGQWQLTVYNILGQEVTSWSDESEAGYYKIEWDASRYASGVYLYRLTAGAFSSTKKMVLLK